MKEREQLLTLAGELSDHLQELEIICQHGKQWLDALSGKNPGILDLRSLGSILHDFYTAIEDIFELIAGDVNGNLPQDSRWHKRLLHLMTLEIPLILKMGPKAGIFSFVPVASVPLFSEEGIQFAQEKNPLFVHR